MPHKATGATLNTLHPPKDSTLTPRQILPQPSDFWELKTRVNCEPLPHCCADRFRVNSLMMLLVPAIALSWWHSFAPVVLMCRASVSASLTVMAVCVDPVFIASPLPTAARCIAGWHRARRTVSNGRNKFTKGDRGRDSGGFVALPWSVLDCPAYARLSHPARSLLFELARQFVRDNNGRLLASFAYLSKRGWGSRDVIVRAKRELLESRFIFETVMGHRPNKASWYAVTWRALDKLPGYDAGAADCFQRGAYLRPSHGQEKPLIGPSHGQGTHPPRPSPGPVKALLPPSPRPSHGHHLDKPSEGVCHANN